MKQHHKRGFSHSGSAKEAVGRVKIFFVSDIAETNHLIMRIGTMKDRVGAEVKFDVLHCLI